MPRIPNVNIRSDPGNLMSGSMNFYIKVDGEKAKRVQKFLDEFPGEVYMGSHEGALKFAKKLHQLVRRCLRTGTPPKGVSWPPHAASTIKSLGPHKLLNLTGFYMRSIKIIDQGPALTIAVGLPRGLKRPSSAKGSSRITMKQIAQILEYGGPKIPARPLWRPAFNEIGGNARLKKDITQGIRKKIRESIIALEKITIRSDLGSRGSSSRSRYKGDWGNFWDDIPVTPKPQGYTPHSDGPDDLPF